MRYVAAVILFLLVSPALLDAQIRVVRVIDGDTYELSTGERVRLIGVDTPEKHVSAKLKRDAERTGQDQATIRQLGALASDYAARLVLNQVVELEYDPANAARLHRDRYGRLLAYVWVVRDGRREVMINRQLILDGYANAYTQYPFRYLEEFRAAERMAREQGRGLWGLP